MTSAIAIFLLSCKSTVNSHQPKGHFEGDFKQADYNKIPKLSHISEYLGNHYIVMGQNIVLSHVNYDLIKAITENKKPVYILTSDDRKEKLKRKLDENIPERLQKLVVIKSGQPVGGERKINGEYTSWARDWAPLSSADDNNKLHLLETNYYSHEPKSDAGPRIVKEISSSPLYSLPIENEGGNFMSNEDGVCVFTDWVYHRNEMMPQDSNKKDPQQVREAYRKLGCIYFLSTGLIEGETTGHIDIFAKFLNRTTLAVNKITDETLELAQSDEKELAKTVQGQLEEIVNSLEAGLAEINKEDPNIKIEIVRVPMPLPLVWTDKKDSAKLSVFRSYLNSLILRPPNKHNENEGVMIVPRYGDKFVQYHRSDPKYTRKYPDSDLAKDYEDKVTTVFKNAGYNNLRFVNMDRSIAWGGATHCSTMQVGLPCSMLDTETCEARLDCKVSDNTNTHACKEDYATSQ